jgi:hypothetical protein
VLTENVPTDMVRVVVGRQYPGKRQAGLFYPPDQRPHVIGRVDEQHLTRSGVADHVDVVAHGGRELVTRGEVPTSEELAEKEPFWHRPIVQTARAELAQRGPQAISCKDDR